LLPLAVAHLVPAVFFRIDYQQVLHLSLRQGIEAGELHRAAITMTRGPHADGQAASKK
jgi:hypothetical protein